MTKIINAFKSRLGGEKYQLLRSYHQLKQRPDWPFPENCLKNILAQLAKTRSKGFFVPFHSRTMDLSNYYRRIYQCLCASYTSNQYEQQFDFNGVIVPKPIGNSDKTFTSEFIDFYSYYLVDDVVLCNAATYEGPYETENVRIQSGDIVVDCGANMGLFSAVASRKGATIYAFEPSPYIIETYLSKTAQWNPNIHICNVALSDKENQMEFVQDYENIGGGTLLETNRNRESVENAITVQAIPLDMYVEKNNIPRIDFIKADIEGAERYLLMGAKRVLKEFAPKIAICTYHLPDDPKVLRELILDANPNYIITERFKKMYAYVR